MNFEEITQENSFWKLYKLTRKINTAKDTFWVFLLSVFLLFVYYSLRIESLIEVESLVASSTSTVLSASISLIGFIFAAYVVFANMTDKKLMYVMAMNKHPKYDMSFLKYGHCNFIKIMLDLLCIAILTYLGSVIIPTLPKFNELGLLSLKLIYLFLLATYQSFFVLILMLCKSAIFNVYHSIMMSMRWYAEEEYQQQNDKKTE
jgi:hypothetical protein